MAVTFTVLGSGSSGNCTVISSSQTQVLVDAGFSCRETIRRMKAAGLEPAATKAILVTHEHSDHIQGVERLSRLLNVPIYMTEGTYQGWRRWARDKAAACELQRIEIFKAGLPFEVGDLQVRSFTIPHDVNDPVGFTLRVEGVKVAVATDLGYLPANVVDQLQGCDVMMIESNHDLEMLRTGPYPWPVKQRVLSKKGHLSNAALAEFFCSGYDGAATYVILAHLSEANNHPEIARTCAERALDQNRPTGKCLLLASQHKPLESIKL